MCFLGMFLKIHEIHLHMKCGVPIGILYYAHVLHIYCVLAMEKIIGVDQIRIFRKKKNSLICLNGNLTENGIFCLLQDDYSRQWMG